MNKIFYRELIPSEMKRFSYLKIIKNNIRETIVMDKFNI